MGGKKTTYGADGRGDLLNFRPEVIDVITDKTHPQYDPRVERPIDEAMVLSIMALGVIEPLVIARDGDRVYVVDGKQRRRNAIEANERLGAQGLPTVLVPCIWRRGDDGALFEVQVAANEVRTAESPMERAKKMERLRTMGRDVTRLAVIFGCTEQTVRNSLALLECAPTVQHAIESGEVPATIAKKMSKLPRVEQAAKLDEMKAAGATKGKAATDLLDGPKAPRMRSRRVVERFMAGVEASGTASEAVLLALKFVLGDDDAFDGIGSYSEIHAAAKAALS